MAAAPDAAAAAADAAVTAPTAALEPALPAALASPQVSDVHALLTYVSDASAPATLTYHALHACFTLLDADSDSAVSEFERRFVDGKGVALTLAAVERHLSEPTAKAPTRGLRVLSMLQPDSLSAAEMEQLVRLLLRVIAAHPTNGPVLAACYDMLNNVCRGGVEDCFWAQSGPEISMSVLQSPLMLSDPKVVDSLFAAMRTLIRDEEQEAEMTKRGFMEKAVEALRMHPADPDAARSVVASIVTLFQSEEESLALNLLELGVGPLLVTALKHNLSDARTIEDGVTALSSCLIQGSTEDLDALVSAGVLSLLADLLPAVLRLEIGEDGGQSLLKYLLGRLRKLVEDVELETIPSAEIAVLMKRCVEILNDPAREALEELRMPTLGLLALVTEDKERYQTLFREADGMQCLLGLLKRHRADSSLVGFVLRSCWYASMDDLRNGHCFVTEGGLPLLFELLAAFPDASLVQMMGLSVLESITDVKLSDAKYARGVVSAEAQSWIAAHVEAAVSYGGIELVMRHVQGAKEGAEHGLAFILLLHLTRSNGDNRALQDRIALTPGLYSFVLSSLRTFKHQHHLAAILTQLVREGAQDGETLTAMGAVDLLLALFAESADEAFRTDIVKALARITRAHSARPIIAASKTFLPSLAHFFASLCAQLQAAESAGQEEQAMACLNGVTACCALVQNLCRDATCRQLGEMGCIELIVGLMRTHGASGTKQEAQAVRAQSQDAQMQHQLLKYAAGALFSLAFDHDPNTEKLRALDGVTLMLGLLQQYSDEPAILVSVAGCLHILTVSPVSCAQFVALGGLQPLFSALRTAMEHSSISEAASSSSASLAPPLPSVGLVQSLCGVLSNVGRDGALSRAVSNDVQVLLSLIRRCASHFGIVVNAVDALFKVCSRDPELLAEVRDCGGVEITIRALRAHIEHEMFSKIALLLLFQLVRREGDDAATAKSRLTQAIDLGLLTLLDTVVASQKGKGSELEQLSTAFRDELNGSQSK